MKNLPNWEPPKPRNPAYTPAQRDTIMKLQKSGWTYKEIGEFMGVSKSAIAGFIWRQRMLIKKRKRDEVANRG